MKMPIDTSAIQFVSAGPADPVLDYETRTQKVDQNGKPLFNVHLFGITETSRDSISVKVPGEPKGLGNFTPVKVSGLVISDWDTGERHGYSFRADAVETSTKAPV
jgi:hypothetical protein